MSALLVVLLFVMPAFIASHLVRSPVDYRACFSRMKGEWKMVVLVAGD